VTSDALCRATALTQKAPLPSRSLLARPPHGERAWKPPRQNEQCRCLFKATDHTPSRTPFISSMLSLATEPGWIGLLAIRVHAITPAPFQAPQIGPPLPRKTRHAALPDFVLMRLAAHLDHAGEMPLTDFCNRHPTRAPDDRSTLEPAACAAATASTQRLRGF